MLLLIVPCARSYTRDLEASPRALSRVSPRSIAVDEVARAIRARIAHGSRARCHDRVARALSWRDVEKHVEKNRQGLIGFALTLEARELRKLGAAA
jgi:hypothetical protein